MNKNEVKNLYSFGSPMPGRSWPTQTAADNTSAGTKPYRYGFNGKENDFEVKNIGGSQQDYGMRIYDPRLGRFLSVDPLFREYPFYTPYQFAGNKPIKFVDMDGKEEMSAERMARSIEAKQLNVSYSKVIALQAEGTERAAHFLIVNFAPIVSDVNDANDAWNEMKAGNYWMAGLSAASLIPGADFVTKPIKWVAKYSDEVTKLVKFSGKLNNSSREIITKTISGLRTDAVKVTKGLIGDLGDDAIALPGRATTKYPDADKIVVGMQSADGKKGWRIDYDDSKGAHYNWFNKETGEEGAVLFDGTKEQVENFKEQFTKTFNLPEKK